MRRLLIVLAACGAQPPASVHDRVAATPVASTDCGLPADWHLADLAQASLDRDRPPTTQVIAIRVLAWQQTIDDRPLRIDSALVWIRASSPHYTIAHLYRHPDDGPLWQRSMVFDAPGFEDEIFSDKPPTHAELEDFLGATDWPFAAEDDFKLVASGVCASAWQASFNEPPWHAYH